MALGLSLYIVVCLQCQSFISQNQSVLSERRRRAQPFGGRSRLGQSDLGYYRGGVKGKREGKEYEIGGKREGGGGGGGRQRGMGGGREGAGSSGRLASISSNKGTEATSGKLGGGGPRSIELVRSLFTWMLNLCQGEA